MSPDALGIGAAIVACVAAIVVWKFAKLVLKLVVVVVLCVVAGLAVRQWAQSGGALPLPSLPRYSGGR